MERKTITVTKIPENSDIGTLDTGPENKSYDHMSLCQKGDRQPTMDGIAQGTLVHWNCLNGKLYGKSNQAEQLVQVYLRRTSPKPDTGRCQEFVLLVGPSGVGKTALALTLEAKTKQDGGCFCRGKFDRPTNLTGPNADDAHGPFFVAISQFVNEVTQREKSYMTRLQKALEKRLDSSELQVLVESIPALQKILNVRPVGINDGWHGLQGPDAAKRYNHIFSKFVTAICSQDHPLVLLIDDIQWANQSSMRLLISLASSIPAEAGFLLLCTARANDVGPEGHISELLSELRERGVIVTNIEVFNLSKDAVSQLLSDLMQRPLEESLSLAEVIHRQTDGNAFFVFQYLSVLEGEGRLCSGRLGQYDVASICPTVANLLLKKIHQLPDNALQVLKVSSCLGTTIHEMLLTEAVSTGLTSLAVRPALLIAEQQGLIRFDSKSGTGCFLHDSIQQAFYELIPKDLVASTHLYIGRRLWNWLPPKELNRHLLLVTNHLVCGLHLLADPVEKEDLAALLLRAGQKSALSSAFPKAANYFQLGIGLLGRKHWKRHYQLSLALYDAAAEVEYYCGNLERVDLLLNKIFKHAQTFDDRLRAYFTQVYSLGSRDNTKQALAKGLDTLQLLGETFPRRPGKRQGTRALNRCRKALRGMDDSEIMNLCIMRDNRKLTGMRLLNTIVMYAFSAKQELVALMTARMIDNTLRHGMSGASCIGFALIGFFLGLHGCAEDGYRFCRLSLCIMEKFNAVEWQSRVALGVFGGVYSVRRPLRESIKPLLAAHRVGLVVGDIHSAMACASYMCRVSLCASIPLPQLVIEIESFQTLCQYYGQTSVGMLLSHQMQFCQNFMGLSENPLILTGDVINNEDETIERLRSTHPVSLSLFLFMKHMLAVYFNDMPLANQLSIAFQQTKNTSALATCALHMHLFLEGVAAAALSRNRQHDQIRRAQRIQKQLQCQQLVSPENYTNKVCLVEAERATSSGDRQLAMVKYQQSIEMAGREGFVHEQALACERAGYALVEWRRLVEARQHLQQASSLYQQWGAQGKVKQLEMYINKLQ